MEKEKLFSEDAFDKRLSIGDELSFVKNELRKLRIDLTWAGTDLDVCAFLLDENGLIREKSDLVFYNSQLRWKTRKEFSDPDFNPLDGERSTWPAPGFRNPRKWMERTLPLSTDGSVIGSWDDMAEDDEDDDDKQETLHVLLDDVDVKRYSSIVLAAAVAPDRILRGETFADAHNPVATIYNAQNNEGELIAEYKLAAIAPGKDAVCFGKLEWDQKAFVWKFIPLAEGYNGGMEYLAREVFD